MQVFFVFAVVTNLLVSLSMLQGDPADPAQSKSSSSCPILTDSDLSANLIACQGGEQLHCVAQGA